MTRKGGFVGASTIEQSIEVSQKMNKTFIGLARLLRSLADRLDPPNEWTIAWWDEPCELDPQESERTYQLYRSWLDDFDSSPVTD